MRIFNAEGRRRNQTGTIAPAPSAGSIPMSDKLGVDDGLLDGGRIAPDKPEVESVDPEERPRRERPRNNPPPPVSINMWKYR